MSDETRKSLYKRLTRIFRGGPITSRKVSNYRQPVATSAQALFSKTQSHVYSNAIAAYGQYDRMARYADFSEMEYTPEIASALDIYADEACAQDELGHTLHIHSSNKKIKTILEELFFGTININFNLRPWARNLVKYGDFFLFNDISERDGIVNVFPIPVNEVEREEGFDPTDPMAVRFRWIVRGNEPLQNWQVTHFRNLGNDAFLPYGSSLLEPARRIWRQLVLIEDAMLVYRVVRSPERRIFYIDVGGIPPEQIETYMEQQKSKLRSNVVIDKETSKVDLRYNPLSVDEDYFIPIRGDSGTKIDTLAGGTYSGDIDDVQYIQSKLFAALKVPKAYLGYDENLSSKATLAQEDIRFSRTIQRLQQVLISELNKLAAIHLYILGFNDSDILNFELKLSNPSANAEMQRLENLNTKFTIADTGLKAGDGTLFSRHEIRKLVFNSTNEDEKRIDINLENDKKFASKLEKIAQNKLEPDEISLTGIVLKPDEKKDDISLDPDNQLSDETDTESDKESDAPEDLFASAILDDDDDKLIMDNEKTGIQLTAKVGNDGRKSPFRGLTSTFDSVTNKKTTQNKDITGLKGLKKDILSAGKNELTHLMDDMKKNDAPRKTLSNILLNENNNE